MAQYSNRVFACPFFTSAKKPDRVNCEGGRVKMPEAEATAGYSSQYCEGDWKRCSIAQQLMEFYERKDNENDKQAESRRA